MGTALRQNCSLDDFLYECTRRGIDAVAVKVVSDTIDQLHSARFKYIVIAPVSVEYTARTEKEATLRSGQRIVGALCYDKKQNPPQEPVTRPAEILEGMAQPMEEILQDADLAATYILQHGIPRVRVFMEFIHGREGPYEKRDTEITSTDRVQLPPRWG